jgi:TorA maturation chaperone TorD
LTHVCAADCNPCETSYLSKHLFQVSQRLAAITGFYHAFGLSPAGERPDHIAVELEFLGFLCCREALEAADGASGSSLEMRAAQTTFLSNHLGKWAPAFALLVLRKAPAGPIRLLAELMDAAIRSEAKRLEVTLPDSPLDVGASLADRDFLHSSPMALAMGSFSEGVFRE